MVVHLVYKEQRDLTVWYTFHIQTYRNCKSFDFGEVYRSVQQVYENAVSCRLFDTPSKHDWAV